jgi:hypothetical protein
MSSGRARAHALLRSSGDAIVASGRQDTITFGIQAPNIFGFSAAEAIGCSLDLIIPSRPPTCHSARLCGSHVQGRSSAYTGAAQGGGAGFPSNSRSCRSRAKSAGWPAWCGDAGRDRAL